MSKESQRYRNIPTEDVLKEWGLVSHSAYLVNITQATTAVKGTLDAYIHTLKKQPEVMHDWNDTIWTVMIEKAIVHKDGQITFVFQNGTEIKVGA